MSRSYKKSPVCTDGSPKGVKRSKQIANDRVKTRYKDEDYCPRARSEYKKKTEYTYDIHDYVTRLSEEDARREWELYWKDFYSSFEEYYNKDYAKYFIRK